MATLDEFRFPVRDADIWAPDEDGKPRPWEDKEADLDMNQRAVEDYLTNDLPAIYITQSGLGSGIIDPTQLASGTPTTGYAPVYNGTEPAWTDIATQAELNAVVATITSNALLALQFSVTNAFLVMGA